MNDTTKKELYDKQIFSGDDFIIIRNGCKLTVIEEVGDRELIDKREFASVGKAKEEFETRLKLLIG